MGGILNSAEGFLGLSDGPKAPGVQSGNLPLQALNQSSLLYTKPQASRAILDYGSGRKSFDDALSASALTEPEQHDLADQLATGATTGSRFATEQIQKNPVLGSLFGEGGQMSKQIGQYGKQSGLLDDLQSQGFNLKPEDQSLYGQMSGNIARQFGQAGNAAASNLAARGLSSSGAAGAMFSGLQGNQNEMLAQAQQQIGQQRVQNTMQQIGQQQQFLSQLGGNINNMGNSAENAINQQYGRQLSGAQHQQQGLFTTAGLQNQANAGVNKANLDAANFEQENKPQNLFDMAQGGLNSAIGAQSTAAGQKAGSEGKGMGGAGMASMFGV